MFFWIRLYIHTADVTNPAKASSAEQRLHAVQAIPLKDHDVGYLVSVSPVDANEQGNIARGNCVQLAPLLGVHVGCPHFTTIYEGADIAGVVRAWDPLRHTCA